MANPRTIARLEARIQERAAYCLQFEINDPRAVFITIQRVELSHDLSSGKIFYSVLGDEGDKSRAAHMLKSAAGFIQRQVSGVLTMRRMPRLVFEYDDSVEKAASLDHLIREARARDRSINPDLDDALPPAAPAPAARAQVDEDHDDGEADEFDEFDDDEDREADEFDDEPESDAPAGGGDAGPRRS